MFGWLLLRGRLKTRDRLFRFGLINDNSCPLCNNNNNETDFIGPDNPPPDESITTPLPQAFSICLLTTIH